MDIPSAATVEETTIIDSRIANVWNAIKSVTFEFLSSVKSTKVLPNKAASKNIVGSTRVINYKDGTSQTIQITSISNLSRSIAYTVIASEPAISYTSAEHEIMLTEVTMSNQTFIEWRTDFSSDASIQVIEDSRFKKKEGFNDLRAYILKKSPKKDNKRKKRASRVLTDIDFDEKKGSGFESPEEAVEFTNNFYNALCESLSRDTEIIITDDMITKYLSTYNFVLIHNGIVLNGVKQWIPFHNALNKVVKKVNTDIKIESYCGYSIALSYVSNMIFINGQHCVIRGNTSIVVGNDKKIRYLVETPNNENLNEMKEIIKSIMIKSEE